MVPVLLFMVAYPPPLEYFHQSPGSHPGSVLVWHRSQPLPVTPAPASLPCRKWLFTPAPLSPTHLSLHTGTAPFPVAFWGPYRKP